MELSKTISWNPKINSETEDRIEFLKMPDNERWNYMMAVVLMGYPKGKKVEYKKRIITWI